MSFAECVYSKQVHLHIFHPLQSMSGYITASRATQTRIPCCLRLLSSLSVAQGTATLCGLMRATRSVAVGYTKRSSRLHSTLSATPVHGGLVSRVIFSNHQQGTPEPDAGRYHRRCRFSASRVATVVENIRNSSPQIHHNNRPIFDARSAFGPYAFAEH